MRYIKFIFILLLAFSNLYSQNSKIDLMFMTSITDNSNSKTTLSIFNELKISHSLYNYLIVSSQVYVEESKSKKVQPLDEFFFYYDKEQKSMAYVSSSRLYRFMNSKVYNGLMLIIARTPHYTLPNRLLKVLRFVVKDKNDIPLNSDFIRRSNPILKLPIKNVIIPSNKLFEARVSYSVDDFTGYLSIDTTSLPNQIPSKIDIKDFDIIFTNSNPILVGSIDYSIKSNFVKSKDNVVNNDSIENSINNTKDISKKVNNSPKPSSPKESLSNKPGTDKPASSIENTENSLPNNISEIDISTPDPISNAFEIIDQPHSLFFISNGNSMRNKKSNWYSIIRNSILSEIPTDHYSGSRFSIATGANSLTSDLYMPFTEGGIKSNKLKNAEFKAATDRPLKETQSLYEILLSIKSLLSLNDNKKYQNLDLIIFFSTEWSFSPSIINKQKLDKSLESISQTFKNIHLVYISEDELSRNKEFDTSFVSVLSDRPGFVRHDIYQKDIGIIGKTIRSFVKSSL